MAWRGFREAAAGESGLELSLGLPAYFSKSSGQAGFDGEEPSGGGFALQAKGSSNDSKARPAAAPVVGWPPVRSFRRNLASSSTKPSPQPSQNGGSKEEAAKAGAEKGLFVKINMDGVPIGRKVDLKAYGGYAELSAAVDKLFRGLLAAQNRDPGAAADGGVITAGVMGGSGEYTLVYEDDEGDRMLVGDVPWGMFIATAKRLRVLKSSDLPATSLRPGSRKRAAAGC